MDRATALLAGEAGLVRAGATRFDATLRFWTYPCFLLTEPTVGVARYVGFAPLVGVMWKARWIVIAIAVVQAVAADQVALAGLGAVGLKINGRWSTGSSTGGGSAAWSCRLECPVPR